MARKIMTVGLVFILGASLSGCATEGYYSTGRSAAAGAMEQKDPIYEELAEQGRMTTGQITIVYGVPCVEVMLKSGEKHNDICPFHTFFKEKISYCSG